MEVRVLSPALVIQSIKATSFGVFVLLPEIGLEKSVLAKLNVAKRSRQHTAGQRVLNEVTAEFSTGAKSSQRPISKNRPSGRFSILLKNIISPLLFNRLRDNWF